MKKGNGFFDRLKAAAMLGAAIVMGGAIVDTCMARGVFKAECVRDGKVIWSDEFPNTVVTVGKNAMLDQSLAGSAYTVTGPYMGLISSVSYSAISASDTMTSHAGWLEAGATNAPTYTSPRKTCAWSAASGGSKALSAALAFPITSTGTLKGAFIVYGTGAVSTIDNTGGTLFSAGPFTGGDRAVLNGDTVNVSYTISL